LGAFPDFSTPVTCARRLPGHVLLGENAAETVFASIPSMRQDGTEIFDHGDLAPSLGQTEPILQPDSRHPPTTTNVPALVEREYAR